MSPIDAAVIAVAERDEAVVRDRIAAARPDLVLIGPDETVPAAAALIAFEPPPDPARYATIPWVHCAGAGADRLLGGLGFRPPLMTRTVGRMGAQIGEYVAAYLLADLQGMETRRARQAEAAWDKIGCLPSYAFDTRALILGTGGIGGGIAARLGALGVSVDGVSRSGRPADGFETVFRASVLPTDLSGYDTVVCALPATPETRRFVGEAFLDRLRDALLVSVGRGASVDHEAVAAALSRSRLRHAVLDVFETEPLAHSSPLWGTPAVTITPHISGVTRPEDIADAFLIALAAVERGDDPPLIVDQTRGY